MLDIYNRIINPFWGAFKNGSQILLDFLGTDVWTFVTRVPIFADLARPSWFPDVTMLVFLFGASLSLFLAITLVKWIVGVVRG